MNPLWEKSNCLSYLVQISLWCKDVNSLNLQIAQHSFLLFAAMYTVPRRNTRAELSHAVYQPAEGKNIQYYVQDTIIFKHKTLNAQMRIPIHSSPMLQVNCPFLAWCWPHPSPCNPWTHPLDPAHICDAQISKRWHSYILFLWVYLAHQTGNCR
jgi:hypothetical protein